MQNSIDQYFRPAHQYISWTRQAVPLLTELRNKTVPPKNIRGILTEIRQSNNPPPKSRIFKNDEKEGYSLKYLGIEPAQSMIDLLSELADFLMRFQPSRPIELLRAGRPKRAQYDKKSIFYLVVLMFFGLVPNRTHYQEYKRFNNMTSFAHVLSHSEFKTKCLLQYLKQTLRDITKTDITVLFVVQRNLVRQSLDQLFYEFGSYKLAPIKILQNSSSIEDFNGQIKIDFANRFIGGGCLRNGCVQEEIMFAVRPELYALTLLCQQMQSNEAIAFSGFRRRFNSQGYGDKTCYAGKCQEHYSYDLNEKKEVTFNEYIVAIDALKFVKMDSNQYLRHSIDRQIKKAVAGFSMYRKKTIVSGGWGCGVYNGDFQLKLIIQWIAASISGNQLYICPFGRKSQIMRSNLIQKLQDYSLNQAYDLLLTAARQRKGYEKGIFEIILGMLRR